MESHPAAGRVSHVADEIEDVLVVELSASDEYLPAELTGVAQVHARRTEGSELPPMVRVMAHLRAPGPSRGYRPELERLP